jgi:hypothetical protein
MFLSVAILGSLIALLQSLFSVTAFNTCSLQSIRQHQLKQSTSAGPLYSLHGTSDVSTQRRDVLQKGLTFGSLVAASITAQVPQSAAVAKNTKSRTDGYAIQHTEKEWQNLLTKQQYFILREGGTESPYSSILEGEERTGLCKWLLLF